MSKPDSSANPGISDMTAEIVAGGAITVAQVAKRIPAARGAGRTNPATVFRWITKGIRLPGGRTLKLQAVRLAGRWLTTAAAIAAFIEGQMEASQDAPSLPRPARQRQAADAEASRQLERLGI